MTDSNIERALGILMGKVDEIGKQMAETRQDMQISEEKSDKSRGHMHHRLDGVTNEIHKLNVKSADQATTLEGLQKAVIEVQAVTDNVKNMRQQALGAGTLGRWLLWLGGAVLTGAGWLVAAYTWVTGRPPP